MKKNAFYFIMTFIMVQMSYAVNLSDYTVIKGIISIPDFKAKEVTLYNVDEGKPVVAATAKVNSLGEFGFLTPVSAAGFYYVDYGQFKNKKQLIRLYLEPKLDISLVINQNNYVLSGKNIGQNALVQKANEIYNEFAPFARIGENVTYVEFYPFIDKGIAKAEEFSKSIKTKDVAFNELLKLAVATDVEELTYTFFRMPRSAFPDKDDRPAVINTWIKDKKFTNPDLLKLQNGVSLMSNYFFYLSMNSSSPVKRIDIVESLDHITDPALKDVYLRDAVANSRMKIEEYEKIAPSIKPFMISDASKAFLLEYEKVLHKSVGQKGLDFTYKDINDKPVSFSDFKGKFVYIDLWATWCGPCKAEIPHMKKIEEDYHGKNIVFVSLSLDKAKDAQKWKDYVTKEQLKGIQLMADKDFGSDVAKNYEVNAIPRFLLFDPKGNIINADALRPSNPELRVQLDKLLKS
ncbi:thiol-disulfide isomerase/thioredoxin [Flavobacterium nitrogenifigens]|uniref:Thiol-disulfide isomerase/thioredoxin n=2 Tax=Flavobacterium TaxID=237 RepID=A0A7W7IX63_9FLAO|nr:MULTISPECIES: TlpA disulfide reductase family protein [Flavobacterium]MBB4801570.1 thiol-disulfide isomerase/thioredoxin [Flavobacterium nitrogenifigens]MBB6386527.1 thiol-disulfide isomerase/thioredoxin [Flavobacterium notoginsengisoli]